MGNFLREYEKQMSQFTDAPDAFHTAAASTVLGSLLTTFPYRLKLAGGTGERYPNLWTFLIGDSANSRKSTAVNLAAEVLHRAYPELRAPDDGSPEGFAKDLVSKNGRLDGNAASLMIQSEMGNFLANMAKDYNTGFKTLLMELYDTPALYRRKLSKDEFQVPRPRVSILGALAVEFMPTMLTAMDWTNGFMGRALLVYGRRTRTLPHPKTPSNATYRDLARQLMATCRTWKLTRKKMMKRDGRDWAMDYEPAALKYADEMRKRHCPDGNDINVLTLRGRASIHLQKLAAVEQVSMDPEAMCITREAVDAAWGLFYHWWEHSPTLMEGSFSRSNSDVEGDRIPRRILRILTEAGAKGVPEMELMGSVIIDYERFSKALTSLEMMGVVERFSIEGDERTFIRKVSKK